MMIIKYLETDLLHYYVLTLYESLYTSLSYATTMKYDESANVIFICRKDTLITNCFSIHDIAQN